MEISTSCNFSSTQQFDSSTAAFDDNLTTTGYFITQVSQDVDSRPKVLEWYSFIFEHIQALEYLVCFLANVLTISAVIKFDYLHKKPTNILILSLSVADGLLGKYFY